MTKQHSPKKKSRAERSPAAWREQIRAFRLAVIALDARSLEQLLAWLEDDALDASSDPERIAIAWLWKTLDLVDERRRRLHLAQLAAR